MKITIESTEEFANFGGEYCRVWRGTDSKGQKVIAFVHHILSEKGADTTEMKASLRTVPMTNLEQMHVCTKEDIGPVLEE